MLSHTETVLAEGAGGSSGCAALAKGRSVAEAFNFERSGDTCWHAPIRATFNLEPVGSVGNCACAGPALPCACLMYLGIEGKA